MEENTNEEKLETLVESPKKSFPFMTVIAVLAVIAIGVTFLTKSSGIKDNKMAASDIQGVVAGDETSVKEEENSESESLETTETNDDTNSIAEAKTISVEGGMFYFKPNEIRVKKGQTVRIEFKNVEGFHDFVLDEFKVQSKKVKAGESDMIEFTPDKTGSFEFYCSIGNHRTQGMKGTLIVE